MNEKGSKPILRIELTLEQQEQVWRATGKQVAALELTPEQLEERIAPGRKAGVGMGDSSL